MKTIILNDANTLLRQKWTYVALIVLVVFGLLTGFRFHVSISDELASNAPYTMGFMIGLLSLSLILIATVLAFSLLFKEQDAHYESIVFTTPIDKRSFALARFCSFYLLTLIGFLFLIIGYVVGLHLVQGRPMNQGFITWHYLYPFFLFGGINAMVVCSILFAVAQRFKSKLLVAVSGVLLYVLYMIALMFSNAPFMAQALPQSLRMQQISAIVDLFGLSGYFYEAKDLSVLQKNSQVVPLSQLWLLNRLIWLGLSLLMVHFGVRSFSFLPKFKGKPKRMGGTRKENKALHGFSTAETVFNVRSERRAIRSFSTVDAIYLFKSIPMVTVALLLLFYIGVEMFDAIDKGIRLPQLYASSGLLAQSINGTFYALGALIMVYFVNDIHWRSTTTGFSKIENTTFHATQKIAGHMGSLTILIAAITILLLTEAIIFQWIFDHPYLDWGAYLGMIVFNTIPLLLFAFFLLFVNSLCRRKSIALGISILCFLLFSTPISNRVLPNSLFRFFTGYRGAYSDFIGYGAYLYPFLWRLAFGFSLVGMLYLVYNFFKIPSKRKRNGAGIVACMILAILSSTHYLKHQAPKKDGEALVLEQVSYEKKYRKYQHIDQPALKKLSARIDLYPNERSYTVQGEYILKNTHGEALDSILVHIPEDVEIKSVFFQYQDETIPIERPITEVLPKLPLQPLDSAKLVFELSYQWDPVNGHDPFNAIVKNGSFMRISRYFPQLGYDQDNELTDSQSRATHGLGSPSALKKLEAPKVGSDDALDLTLLISTPADQIAVGTGELKQQWQEHGRNHFEYAASSIPFRFALSSAAYQTKHTKHKNIDIKVHYHPLHGTNVDHLIQNTKITLDYCLEHFGPYPFTSITFAEISSFTQGFAGTAYPGTIFMTEDVTFNANLKAGNNQDVVNELAGHEVAHLWWGTNQIAPDIREGYAVLTESLAMYTEMMVYKKIYGVDKMKERLAIHQQIYDAEKGFNKMNALIKVAPGEAYLAYSKGALVFVALSELIGEDCLNRALQRFLQKNRYPNARPTARDLLHEILEISDSAHHTRIRSLFY